MLISGLDFLANYESRINEFRFLILMAMSDELFRNRLTLNVRKGMSRALSNNHGHLELTFGPNPLSERISFSQSSIAVEFKEGEKPSIMLKLFLSTAK